MNKGALLCVLVFVWACVCVAGEPTRPAISDQFYAEVHISINNNNRALEGGGMEKREKNEMKKRRESNIFLGILAFDVPKDMGRTDFKFEDSQHKIETIHVLERYDLVRFPSPLLSSPQWILPSPYPSNYVCLA
jgi:hypothetical protein